MSYGLASIMLVAAVICGGFCSLHGRFSSGICKHEGLNPLSEEGLYDTYANCVRSEDGSFTAHCERCPNGQLFDPKNLQCTKEEVSDRTRRMAKREAVAPDAPITPRTTPMPTPIPLPTYWCHRTFSCASCTSLRVCSRNEDNTYEHKRDINCTGSKPYCDSIKNACVSKLPEYCDSGFQCLSEGYFPDANDCTIFHYCVTLPYSTILRDTQGYCDEGYVFSGDLGACKPKGSNDDCHVARCPEDANGVHAFPGEPKYYVACEYGKAEFVAACPENQEFSPGKEECEVVCKGPGKIADPDDCERYYECTATTVKGPPYEAINKRCPWGLVYNATRAKCAVGVCYNHPPFPAA